MEICEEVEENAHHKPVFWVYHGDGPSAAFVSLVVDYVTSHTIHQEDGEKRSGACKGIQRLQTNTVVGANQKADKLIGQLNRTTKQNNI